MQTEIGNRTNNYIYKKLKNIQKQIKSIKYKNLASLKLYTLLKLS